MPEFIIFLYIVSCPIIIFKFKKLNKEFDKFLLKIFLLILVLVFPNLILVFIIYPIYDGLRLFLWSTPYLVIISLFFLFNNE